MQKPLVFISHINEEKEIAQSLKKLVESTFLNMIEVFVSSDPTSIKLGGKWLDDITHALKNCAVEIILASPESVKRPWINFEGGSGWVRDIPVVPLCHSGMVPAKLPAPLNQLQAATATEAAQLKLIFPVLADAVGSALPDVDFSSFIAVVKEFEATSRQIKELHVSSPIAPTDGLLPHELATLIELADQSAMPGDKVSVFRLRKPLERLGFRGAQINISLKSLSRKNLVELGPAPDYDGEDYPAAMVSDEGWDWLESNHDKINPKRGPAELTSGVTQRGEEDVPF